MRSFLKWAGVLPALLACLAAGAQTIHDLQINVLLQKNGHATVTQTWDCYVYQGTEWYVPIGSTRGFGMTLKDLVVSESGQVYESDGRNWDIHRSREEKAFRSGIVDKSDGSMELCWGVGSDGKHTWTVSYTLEGLVQSFDECDGFGFQFLGDELPEPPEHVRVIVRTDFDTAAWIGGENVGAWTFGFYDEVTFKSDSVIAESTEPLNDKSRIAVMMRFEKGMFSPGVSNDMTWKKFRKKAFKGSDYKSSGGIGSFVRWMFDDMDGLGGIVLSGLIVGIWLFFSWLRKKYIQVTGNRYKASVFGIQKIEGWWRDAPMDGNIAAVYSILRNGDRLKEDYDKGLIGAYYLRWIQDGIVKLQRDPANGHNVNLVFDPEKQPVFTDSIEGSLYDMAFLAAGDNHILERGEFVTWSRSNYTRFTGIPQQANTYGKTVWAAKPMEERQNVVRMRNFLQDFTLMDQREAGDVRMWKHLMIYAQLFGIADKVAKNFEKLYPAQFKEYTSSIGMYDGLSYYTMLNTASLFSQASYGTAKAKSDAVAAERSRSSGGGGRGSFGGGNSFGGGGSHGGGTR